MILDQKNITKDPVQKKILCNEMHTQPHAAPRVQLWGQKIGEEEQRKLETLIIFIRET